MSTLVMSACWPLVMPPVAKSVLISLADNANDHGDCWPAISTICLRTCYKRSAVIEAIRWLESAGIVVANRSSGRHTSYVIKPNCYRQPVRHADQSATQTGTSGKPVRDTHPSATRQNQSATRTGPVRHADTNRKEPLEPSRSKARSASASGTRLPADWQPTADQLTWARLKRPLVDLVEATEAFRDHWAAQAGAKGRKQDWAATWRQWIRSPYTLDKPNGDKPNGAHHAQTRQLSGSERVRAIADARKAAAAERG